MTTTALVLSSLMHREDYVSGSELAKDAGVSRNAVWKAVEQLRGDGYQIDAARRRGYRLLSAPDGLRDYEVSAHLVTEQLGKPVHCLASVDSTNSYAKREARRGAPHGTLVVAEEQTAGRGRLGRVWESQPGAGLYFSLILRPERPPADAPQLTSVAAVAVAEVLRRDYGIGAQLKWPNDVLVGGRKICGILLEMSCELDRIHYVILGIGINVHPFLRDPGADVAARAVALDDLTKTSVRRAPLLGAVLKSLEDRYYEWMQTGYGRILAEVKSLSCTLGRRVAVSTPSGIVEGIATDIDLSGALVVEEHRGALRKIYAGDVTE